MLPLLLSSCRHLGKERNDILIRWCPKYSNPRHFHFSLLKRTRLYSFNLLILNQKSPAQRAFFRLLLEIDDNLIRFCFISFLSMYLLPFDSLLMLVDSGAGYCKIHRRRASDGLAAAITDALAYVLFLHRSDYFYYPRGKWIFYDCFIFPFIYFPPFLINLYESSFNPFHHVSVGKKMISNNCDRFVLRLYNREYASICGKMEEFGTAFLVD